MSRPIACLWCRSKELTWTQLCVLKSDWVRHDPEGYFKAARNHYRRHR